MDIEERIRPLLPNWIIWIVVISFGGVGILGLSFVIYDFLVL